ncbi:hypothetical protein V6N13_009162 [Hibiscus sabdariffa]|uniref:Uncharacterized protein n=1 Tax=Hibiscus sabdariffa TaxID=183260 RepID=A0ABR2DHC2_9ROSI
MRLKPKEIPKKSKDLLKVASSVEDVDSKDQESHVKVSNSGFELVIRESVNDGKTIQATCDNNGASRN